MTNLAHRFLAEGLFAGVYVQCKLTEESAAKLYALVSEEFPTSLILPPDRYHVTIMYAKTSMMDEKTASITTTPVHPLEVPREVRIDEFVYWEGHDKAGYIVAKLHSPSLQATHQKWKEAGLKHSFDEYSPHITVAKNLPDPANTVFKYNMRNLRLKARQTAPMFAYEQETYEELK